MSRIGKKPIALPKGVQVNLQGSSLKVKGPLGELKRDIHSSMKIEVSDSQLTVRPSEDLKENSKFHGLTRSLLSNMVVGVTQGFERRLTLVGVGYRAALKGKELHLSIGYSHPVIHPIPDGIQIAIDKQTEILIKGADKEKVGQIAADVRSYRRPEPYHGKGIRYSDEVIVTKAGKSSGKK
ncbi:MAG: 50S ribosomal protein L6 [Oligoflexales bacterium]|nr:50S ribosomal protein L6 [Oligoflexales bacterium]